MATPFIANPLLAAVAAQRNVATPGINPAAGGVPSSPSTPPAAAPGAGLAPFSPNPAADFLLNRANRPEEIHTGTNLLGRLAALGVGNKLQRENQQGQQEAIESAISALPPESQAMARIAALSGDPAAILPVLQQQAALTARSAEAEKSRNFTAEQSEAARAFEQKLFDQKEALRRDEFAQTMGMKEDEFEFNRIKHAEDVRSNQASESIQRDKLALEQAKADEKRMQDALKSQNIELNESQGKAMSLLTQISVADSAINERYANYIPSDGVRVFLEQLAQSGSDTVAGAMSRFIRGEVYKSLPDSDKDFVTNALQFAEMNTRDLTGAAMRPDELMTRWASTLPLPGDTAQVLTSKQNNRDAVLEGLISKLPPEAVQAFSSGQ